ncbi:DUF4129 domain-containing protein [Tengunoibacter tsumagoiensis]|uniref:Protein-glutamine gamma-glutamyltransferase-like C-terminal domain-containing protein n=1 Tax=Tengunoibacter tsumagoiensis TaxID=2014871 RepID=A0A401ZTV4_9CHLR|nr:DUF4129 domain-containing protein [Tengunoibacter tsumagoiensis]GCE10293.1 hypothetical protein KTT_01520 [Tengunoibacter tsumagoiensis]
MSTAPLPPPSPDDAELAEAWRKTKIVETIPVQSWGEQILPVIFSAMETCWIGALFIGLAELHIAQLETSPMPLWAPFLLLVCSGWLLNDLDRRSAHSTHTNHTTITFFLGMALLTLFIIWSSIYASIYWPLDPRWFAQLLSDSVHSSGNFSHVLGLIFLVLCLTWRGIAIWRHPIEPPAVMRMLGIGLGVFLFVSIIVGLLPDTVRGSNFELLSLIFPFVIFTLFSHSLANASLKRRQYPDGIHGGAAAQERSLLTIIGGICAILIPIAVIVGFFANPAFLAQALTPIGTAYDWLLNIIGIVVMWVLQFIPISKRQDQSGTKGNLPSATDRLRQPQSVQQSVQHPADPTLQSFLHFFPELILIIFIIGCMFVLWFIIKRRRNIPGNVNKLEIHESLWSWRLFWTQLKAFIQALWRFFFRKKAARGKVEAEVEGGTMMESEPRARTVREIYRALLTWASKNGVRRRENETPYEFKVRLHHYIAHAEPELRVVTDAYTQTRYGEIVPTESEVEQIRSQWQILQQKTRS